MKTAITLRVQAIAPDEHERRVRRNGRDEDITRCPRAEGAPRFEIRSMLG
jgi:hypothetical protein